VATDSSNVRVAVTGEISVAPTGTAAPTTAVSALNVAFVGLGYVSEDGVTESRERSTTDIKAWQNADTVRTVVTDANLSYTFRLIETTEAALELFYGSAAASGSLVVTPATTGGRKSFVIDVVDGDEALRIYIPEGEVSEVGDVVYASGEPIGYEVTVRAYPNTTLGGSAQIFSTSLAA
jgi:hypothetical protein